MHHDSLRLPPWLLPAEKRCGTLNQAKLELKPHQYMVLHPSALLPFAFFLLSSFNLFIASRNLWCLLAALAGFATLLPTIAISLRYL